MTEETTEQAPGSVAGKRYRCGTCGTEALVTKSGTGSLTCCGAEMTRK